MSSYCALEWERICNIAWRHFKDFKRKESLIRYNQYIWYGVVRGHQKLTVLSEKDIRYIIPLVII